MTEGPSEGLRGPGEVEQVEDVDDLGGGRSPLVRTLLTVLVTLLAVGLVVGVVVVLSVLQRDVRTETGEIDLAGTPQLALRVPTADLRIVQGDGDTVGYRARISSGLLDTTFELRRRDGEVEVVARCQRWLDPECGVELTIEVPAGLPVEVRGGSGDVEAAGLSGGVLTVTTGTGDVDASGLALDELAVQTTSGDVEAAFTRQPFAVKASTRSGDVDLSLPDGERRYTVDAASRTGEVENALGGDGSAGGTGSFVRVRTDGGDVEISH